MMKYLEDNGVEIAGIIFMLVIAVISFLYR